MKEQCRTAERFLPEVLTEPTKIIFQLVTTVTVRAIVHMPTICPELFAEHGEVE